MAKMLDVLEAFLNLHGHTYMRLDGSTKPEQRQVRHRLLHSSLGHIAISPSPPCSYSSNSTDNDPLSWYMLSDSSRLCLASC
jgi:hypothetical protein